MTTRQAWRAPVIEDREVPSGPPPRDDIAAFHLVDETRLVGGLIERAVYSSDERARIAVLAQELARAVREQRVGQSGIDAFMHEYGLSNEEGIILMCLAEALLRIPDADTADALITEKIGEGKWAEHLGRSASNFVNASTWGLVLTGTVVRLGAASGADPFSVLKRLVARSGEPVIRQALRHAVSVMADKFVFGQTITEALQRADAYEAEGYRLSYDMLGEASLTRSDADKHFERYMVAIDAIGRKAGPPRGENTAALMARPGLSVKLSAIHPRFSPGKEDRLAEELLPRLIEMARAVRAQGLTLTIDAEEQDKMDLTLALFERAFADQSLANWSGLGLAVQSYSKRAIPALLWLRRLALQHGKRIPLRLVKGAYWDSEIKWAQQRGLSDYPVFTRKLHTDVSYLAAMRLLLSDGEAFFPQFATHNAYAVAAGYAAAGSAPFEFQRLYGMGEVLYDQVVGADKLARPCRIYVPVGEHHDLLAYLIRRLLENGANASFVSRIADKETPLADIIRDPVESAENEHETTPGGMRTKLPLPLPSGIYLPERRNAAALPLSEITVRHELLGEIDRELQGSFAVGPIVDGQATSGGDEAALVHCPHNRHQRLGTVREATPEHIDAALASARAAALRWDLAGGLARAGILDRAADMMERDRAALLAVIVREAGKTLENAQGDLREAVDFLRYYASEARRLFGAPVSFKSPTGEHNEMVLHGRGPFACIAPWNFPLAIFTGQVAAALAAGNPVLAKPAEQTPITAFLAVQILHEAGVPADVLHLLTGGGAVGAALVRDTRIKGIAFTGSNDTAFLIQKSLAGRSGAIIPFIAETGGINAMIADSTALPEQVVRDAVVSAFDSAGQRCSAARALFVQDEIAETVIDMLTGAVAELDIGDPLDFATDIGPVIDEPAQALLDGHKLNMQRQARELVDLPVPSDCLAGSYVSPAVYEIDRLEVLEREVFGPILHVIRYQAGHLDKVCEAVNASGYGLTLGLHSRIAGVADYVAQNVKVGNIYVNRNQIGAVVGVQPFGGEGLSGTGPKAGGPNYLIRFATERVRATNITATGGNAELLAMPLGKDGEVGGG